MARLALHWQIALGMATGAVIGVALNVFAGTATAGVVTDLFLRMLEMVAVPLIVTSLASGVMGLGGAARLGRMFSRTLVDYVTTSLLAILTGMAFVNLIRPGLGGEPRPAPAPAAGIPHAGLVMMAIILQAGGLPAESQGVILAVDRVLDMGRTAVNVWSDACGAAVIDA